MGDKMGFIKFMWKKYVEEKKLAVLREEFYGMQRDLRSMSTKDFKAKYVNPSKKFAELQWEIIKVKRSARIK